jgi:hypothetical protein
MTPRLLLRDAWLARSPIEPGTILRVLDDDGDGLAEIPLKRLMHELQHTEAVVSVDSAELL